MIAPILIYVNTFVIKTMKINEISPDQHVFLSRTADIAMPPKTLYFIGKLPAGDTKTVTIVGSRRPTAYGREVTQKIAGELAQAGVVIVSGLALGIDAIAHAAALDAGGTTIAVLGGGVDDPSPRSNVSLARRMLMEGGALISEYPPGTAPMQYRFLERNRIVSALGDIVIVTEAAARSGTLSTVGHALEQGKTVFTVPGNITSPLSSGCNQLIKQGALPLTDPSDVLTALGYGSATQQHLILGDTPAETAVIDLLKEGIKDGDTLLLVSKLSTSDFNQTLTMLELKGIIRPLGGHQWTLV